MTTSVVRFMKSPRTITNKDAAADGGLVAPDTEAIEVLGFRSMRLTLRVFGFKAPAAGQLVVAMETGMNLDDPTGFTSLGVFDPVGDAPVTEQRVFTDLQRFVRWRVVHFTYLGQPDPITTVATVTFDIEGVLYE